MYTEIFIKFGRNYTQRNDSKIEIIFAIEPYEFSLRLRFYV